VRRPAGTAHEHTHQLYKNSGPEKENANSSCAVRGRPTTPNIAKSPSLNQRRESNHRWWPNLSVYYQNLLCRTLSYLQCISSVIMPSVTRVVEEVGEMRG